LSPIALFGALSLKEVVVSPIQRLFRWPFQMSILDDTLPNFIKKKPPMKMKQKETKGKDQSLNKQIAQKRCVTWR
jgi:hypothetical protein